MAESKYKEEYCAAISISKATVYLWFKTHSAFSDAKKIGLEKSYTYWTDMGKKMANSGNSAVWIFNMKNRFGWRDNPVEDKQDNIHQLH